jgi:hypothetical protein
MKTLLSGSIAGWLAFALLGCGDGGSTGSDDDMALSAQYDAPRAIEGAATNQSGTVLSNQPDVTDAADTDGAPAGLSDESSDAAPPELHWRACGQFEDRDLECAELEVPVDYDQPEAETVSIALRRIRANPLRSRPVARASAERAR